MKITKKIAKVLGILKTADISRLATRDILKNMKILVISNDEDPKNSEHFKNSQGYKCSKDFKDSKYSKVSRDSRNCSNESRH